MTSRRTPPPHHVKYLKLVKPELREELSSVLTAADEAQRLKHVGQRQLTIVKADDVSGIWFRPAAFVMFEERPASILLEADDYWMACSQLSPDVSDWEGMKTVLADGHLLAAP